MAARRVADYAKELGANVEGQQVRAVYEHMGALLADSILQAGLNYNSVVLPRVSAILANFPEHCRISALVNMIDRGETSAFLNWRHMEKVGRFDSLVMFLSDNAVEDVNDLRSCLLQQPFVNDLKNVRGVGPKTIDYISCLVGMESVAVDRHVRTFAKRVGVLEEDYDFLRNVFCYAADLLSISRRGFDTWVWHREASLSSNQMAFAF